jgi:hypothetical protein
MRGHEPAAPIPFSRHLRRLNLEAPVSGTLPAAARRTEGVPTDETRPRDGVPRRETAWTAKRPDALSPARIGDVSPIPVETPTYARQGAVVQALTRTIGRTIDVTA